MPPTQPSPSAPVLENRDMTTECVVCMDQKVKAYSPCFTRKTESLYWVQRSIKISTRTRSLASQSLGRLRLHTSQVAHRAGAYPGFWRESVLPKNTTMSPARARTRTARSGIEHTNHEATASPLANQKGGVLFQANEVKLFNFKLSVSCFIFRPEVSSVTTFVVQFLIIKHPLFVQYT